MKYCLPWLEIKFKKKIKFDNCWWDIGCLRSSRCLDWRSSGLDAALLLGSGLLAPERDDRLCDDDVGIFSLGQGEDRQPLPFGWRRRRSSLMRAAHISVAPSPSVNAGPFLRKLFSAEGSSCYTEITNYILTKEFLIKMNQDVANSMANENKKRDIE